MTTVTKTNVFAAQFGETAPFEPTARAVQEILMEARAQRSRVLAGIAAQGVNKMLTQINKLVAGFKAARQQRKAILQLQAMDDRLLQDIGLIRSQIPFAIAPAAPVAAAAVAQARPAVAAGSANDNRANRAA